MPAGQPIPAVQDGSTQLDASSGYASTCSSIAAALSIDDGKRYYMRQCYLSLSAAQHSLDIVKSKFSRKLIVSAARQSKDDAGMALRKSLLAAVFARAGSNAQGNSHST